MLEPLGIKETFIAETPADLVGVMMCGAVGYHPGRVYHGLLVGPLREAPCYWTGCSAARSYLRNCWTATA